jgi:hypothetical protein
MHWNQANWQMENDDLWWGDEVSGQFVTLSGSDFFTINGRGSSPTVLARAIGMYLVGHMPEEGLTETLTTLHEFLKFYSTESHHYLPSPNLKKVQAVVTTESKPIA